jgi:hypothetical protein
MPESEITCPKCGYANRQGAKFCRGCGSPLQAVAPTVFSPPPPPQPVYYSPPPEPQPVYAPPPRPVRSESPLITLLAWGFGLLFVLLVCFALPFYVSMQKLLEPDTYTQALADENFYTRMPELFVEQMDYSKPTVLNLEGISCINVQDFTRSDWQLISDTFLTSDWLQEQTESLINQYFDFLKADGGSLSLQISSTQAKDLIGSDAGFTFYQSIIETKPTCSLGDVVSIGGWVMNPQSSCLKICKPILDINKNIWDILTSFAGAVPTEYNLENFLNIQPLENLQSLYQLAETAQKASLILIPLALLLLMLTLISRKARSIQGILLFWGLPLAIAGLLCLVIAIAIPLGGQWVIKDMSRAADLYSGVEDLLVDITRQITTGLAKGIGLPAAGMLVVGGVMTVGSMGWGLARRLTKS